MGYFDCWEFAGGVSGGGYGEIMINRRRCRTHRVAYEILAGPIPPGNELHHRCENRRCYNPDHLIPVTHSTHPGNIIDQRRKKTHCPYGHPYDEQNTYLMPTGGRACRTCRKRAEREYKERRASTRAAPVGV